MSFVRFLPEEEKFLIEYYRSNKCLWKISDENYYSKRKRNEVLIGLAGLFNEVYGKIISEDDIKKKWKNLRSTFGRELKKTLKNPPETENGEVYRSKWIHFDDLQFLRDETAAELNLNSTAERLDSSDMEDQGFTPNSVHIRTSKRKKNLDSSDMEDQGFTPNSVHLRTSESKKYVSPPILKLTASNTAIKSFQPKDSIDFFLAHVGKSLRKLPELNIQRCILNIQKSVLEEFEAVENPK